MPTCFVICPFGDPGSDTRRQSDLVYERIIMPVANEKGYRAMRTLDLPAPGDITRRLAEKIAEADIVVADLTGPNPNVMYELALRHATGKPFIHLTDDNSAIPFDVAQMDAIEVGTEQEVVEKAKSVLREQVEQIEEGEIDFSTHSSQYFASRPCSSTKGFVWTIEYSPTLPSEWLDQQSASFRDAVSSFLDDEGIPERPHHRKLLAEYLAYKGAMGLVAQGDLYYHYTVKQDSVIEGYGILRFQPADAPIAIQVNGQERRDGSLLIRFDQPARRVNISSTIDEQIPAFQYNIEFAPDPDSANAFLGKLLHPQASKPLKVGETTLVLR